MSTPVHDEVIEKLLASARRKWKCTPPLRTVDEYAQDYQKAKRHLAQLEARTDEEWRRDRDESHLKSSQLTKLNEENKLASEDFATQLAAAEVLRDTHKFGTEEYLLLEELVTWLQEMSSAHLSAVKDVAAPLSVLRFKQMTLAGSKSRARSARDALEKAQQEWHAYEARQTLLERALNTITRSKPS